MNSALLFENNKAIGFYSLRSAHVCRVPRRALKTNVSAITAGRLSLSIWERGEAYG
jgi:hypothetical protein